MAPFLFALLLLAQEAPPASPDAAATPAAADGPLATALPRKPDAAPPPIQGGPMTPPSDDYGYVAWCYGAVGGYLDLYDRAMPDVIRIERAWPTPSTEENITVVYPSLRDEARASLKVFKRALEAAERASPTPIQTQGVAAIRKGNGVWTGANSVSKAQLAQFWMSWSPPARCEETARTLEARSNLFGQALSANARPAEAQAAPPTRAAPTESLIAPIGLSAPRGAASGLVAADLDIASAPIPEAAPATTPLAVDVPSPVAEPPVPAPTTMIAEPASAAEPPVSAVAGPPPAQPAGEPAPEPTPPELSAIDALLPVTDQPAAPVVEAPPSQPPPAVVAAPPPAARPAPVPPARPRPARKRGLKETLGGLRGPL